MRLIGFVLKCSRLSTFHLQGDVIYRVMEIEFTVDRREFHFVSISENS